MPGGKRGPRPSAFELTREELSQAVERLERRTIRHDSGCWITERGHITGYSQVSVRGWPMLGHVIGYLYYKGPYDPELELDHVDCVARSCWRPDHVEPVTHEENMARWREKYYGSRKLPPIWVRNPGYSTERVREWRQRQREEGKPYK